MGRPVIYYWDLLSTLVGRDIRLRYRRSVLGILWSLINPLISLLIFIFLFQGILKVNVPYYPVYVFSGLLAWNWFSASLSTATFILLQSRDLIRKPLFPTETLVLVSVSSNLVNYVLALPILLGLALVSGLHLGVGLLALPLIVLVQFLFTAGLCFFISVLNVYYRDVEHLVAVVIGIWFYLTPVFYKSGGVERRYAVIFDANPMAHLMAGYRAVFLGQSFPALSSLLGVAVVAAVFFVLGFLFFRRYKGDVVDEI